MEVIGLQLCPSMLEPDFFSVGTVKNGYPLNKRPGSRLCGSANHSPPNSVLKNVIAVQSRVRQMVDRLPLHLSG